MASYFLLQRSIRCKIIVVVVSWISSFWIGPIVSVIFFFIFFDKTNWYMCYSCLLLILQIEVKDTRIQTEYNTFCIHVFFVWFLSIFFISFMFSIPHPFIYTQMLVNSMFLTLQKGSSSVFGVSVTNEANAHLSWRLTLRVTPSIPLPSRRPRRCSASPTLQALEGPPHRSCNMEC